jgi:hypothetical protein
MQKWVHYLMANPDLVQAGITTAKAAEKHYRNYGRNENRAILYNYLHYLAANKDLILAGIKTEQQAIAHFLTYGVRENRVMRFDWQSYLTANLDVRSAGVTTEPQVLHHFVTYGIWEGRPIRPKYSLHHATLIVVFVAHTMDIVRNLNDRYVQPHILFVGDKPVTSCDNPNIVVVRDLPFNIEDKWRLLTFTAWYAVIKNNLYVDYDRLCILEYDAHITSETFCQQVIDAARNAIVVGFLLDRTHFHVDIRPDILANYLVSKGINSGSYGKSFQWLSSTNLCAERSFFADFVDWYDYEYFIFNDDSNLSYYHERLVAVFTKHKNLTTACVKNVITHDQSNSHRVVAPTLVLYDDGTAVVALTRLVGSVRLYSPTFRSHHFKKCDMDADFVNANARVLQEPRGGGLWLWKPYCIVEMLNRANMGDVLVYLDSKYVFVAPLERLFQPGDLLVWKNKPSEPAYSHVRYCKRSVLNKFSSGDSEQAWAGLLVIRKTKTTVAIMREWLQMCCVYEDISDECTYDECTQPNHSTFIDHRHDQSLLTIVLTKHNIPLLSLNNSTLRKQ